MKTEAFKYKPGENTIVVSCMELGPYTEDIYIPPLGEDEDGDEDDDCFHAIRRAEDIYFSSGQYSHRFLKGEGYRKEVATCCRDWITDMLQNVEREAFVNLVSIRVFGAFRLNTTSLVQAHEEYKRIQKQRHRE